MNKKLVASLLSLGLIFSPITGAITETYATEASTDETDQNKLNEALDKISLIKAYVGNFAEIKKNDSYRLADTNSRAAIDRAMGDGAEYAEKTEVTIFELDNHISAIEEATKKLFENAETNIKKLKASVIKADKVITNNSESSEKEEYKSLSAKVNEGKNILKTLKESDIDGDRLIKLSEEISELSNKAIEAFADTNEYKDASEEDFNNLNNQLSPDESSPEDKDLEELKAYIKTIIDSNEDFLKSDKYLIATEEEKNAYTKAIEEYNALAKDGLSKDNYKPIKASVIKIAQAKNAIDGKTDILIDKNLDEEKKIIDELNKLRNYVNTKNDVIKDLTDQDLLRKYVEAVAQANAYARNYMNGDKKSLKDYQELESYLSKLKDEINKKKSQNPGPITPVEPTEEQFKTYEDAIEAIKRLITNTEGIVIDDFYSADQKDAKEAYTKARANAVELAKKQDASLEDLNKAYNAFNKSIAGLNDFLRKRLEKLVDEAKTYVESENFKKASEDKQKTYKELVAKAKEELKKDVADANVLNRLYKDINASKEAIDGKMSDKAKKLKAAIEESKAFMESDHYKRFGSGLTGAPQKAKKNYEELIKKAKELDKAGKLDSEEAKETLELIENAKAFIEGKISEKKYLSNEYYHILMELKKQKGYAEKINQAARKRLEDALDLYNDKTANEDDIFSALDAAINESSVQEFIRELNNPNKNRDELLIKLRALAENEKDFKEGEKYKKAPKELKADYDKALEEAQKIIGMENPTEAEVQKAYDKLKEAVNKLEIRSLIDRRLVVLADKFKENQLKIANPNDRKAIADKINALKNNPYTTMEEVEKVENELDNLIKQQQVVTTTTVAPTTQVPTTQVPTTTRPVSTVTNPGSIVRTGINGIAKVAAVLVVAAIILKLTSKKGDKNENNK